MTSASTESKFFQITEHHVPAQHLREYEHAVVDETKPLLLSVKRYVPKHGRPPREGDITLVCSPALGMPKEMYEPFFEDLTRNLAQRDVGVRGFWIADPAQLSQSAVLNANNLGNAFAWLDHSRDLLQLVQLFGAEMPRPLIGLGHSMGGLQLIQLSLLHPGLFESLLLIEVSLHRGNADTTVAPLAKSLMYRKEVWPSREQLATALRKSSFYAGWDPRVMDLIIKHQYVDVTTSASPDVRAALAIGKIRADSGAVASATPRLFEFNTCFRDKQDTEYFDALYEFDRDLYDTAKSSPVNIMYSWFPTAGVQVMRDLPRIRCPVMYICGEKSDFSAPYVLEKRMKTTGTGFGGSGGVSKGKVKQHIIPGGSHHVIFESKHQKEVVGVSANHVFEIYTEFMERLKELKTWRAKGPEVHQAIDPILVESFNEWHPKKNPDLQKIVELRAKI